MFHNFIMLNRCRVRQVCQQWNKLALEPQLWRDLYPVHWAKGSLHDQALFIIIRSHTTCGTSMFFIGLKPPALDPKCVLKSLYGI